MAFNREFERIAEDWFHDNGPYWKSIGVDVDVDLTIYKRYNAYQKKMFTAMFDSRVFSVPKEEVCNCLIWRQQDATRNSIEAVGQANFSHHELHKKTCNMIQEMLWSQRGINWNDFLAELKRGSCCIKRQFEETIPIFLHQLSKLFPEQYSTFIKAFPDYELKAPDYRGKYAKLSTCNRELTYRDAHGNSFRFDGDELVCDKYRIGGFMPFSSSGYAQMRIPVTDDMQVKITDSNQVTDQTVLI